MSTVTYIYMIELRYITRRCKYVSRNVYDQYSHFKHHRITPKVWKIQLDSDRSTTELLLHTFKGIPLFIYN